MRYCCSVLDLCVFQCMFFQMSHVPFVDGNMVQKCETDLCQQQAVLETSHDSMSPLHDPRAGTHTVVTTVSGDTPTRSQDEVDAVTPGMFLQLVVPSTSTGQYQVQSGVRVRRLDDPVETVPREHNHGSGFTMFYRRQWSTEGVSGVDGTGVWKRESSGGSSSSGGSDTTTATDSTSPVSCTSVVTRTPGYEKKEDSTPNTGISSVTTDVPVTTGMECFQCGDSAIITPTLSARSSTTSEDKCSSAAGKVCRKYTTKRTLLPHRDTASRKKTKAHTAVGVKMSGYTNYPLARQASSPRAPEQDGRSRASPGEQVEIVEDIVFPSGWPTEGSYPVEAVLGKPLGTSSPIRPRIQTRSESAK